MKLPFRVHTDPIFKARSDYLEKQGKRPFLHYYVPQAIIKFKQGFGRLIRNRSDRGVIITLDNRIIFKDYGKAFLTSLPKAKVLKGSFAAITEYIRKWQENS
jgi:ATP-dependent DNA helicase DinG